MVYSERNKEGKDPFLVIMMKLDSLKQTTI